MTSQTMYGHALSAGLSLFLVGLDCSSPAASSTFSSIPQVDDAVEVVVLPPSGIFQGGACVKTLSGALHCWTRGREGSIITIPFSGPLNETIKGGFFRRVDKGFVEYYSYWKEPGDLNDKVAAIPMGCDLGAIEAGAPPSVARLISGDVVLFENDPRSHPACAGPCGPTSWVVPGLNQARSFTTGSSSQVPPVVGLLYLMDGKQMQATITDCSSAVQGEPNAYYSGAPDHIATFASDSLARTADGAVYARYDPHGPPCTSTVAPLPAWTRLFLPPIDMLSPGVTRGSGYGGACAREPTGAVWCWGIAASLPFIHAPLTQCSECLSKGSDTYDCFDPTRVPELDGAIDIDAKGCAVMADHTVKCWGEY